VSPLFLFEKKTKTLLYLTAKIRPYLDPNVWAPAVSMRLHLLPVSSKTSIGMVVRHLKITKDLTWQLPSKEINKNY
jgi:hypothetical protein